MLWNLAEKQLVGNKYQKKSQKLNLFFPPVDLVNPFFSLQEATGRLCTTGGDSECLSMFPLSAFSPLSEGGIKVRKEGREKEQQSERQRI